MILMVCSFNMERILYTLPQLIYCFLNKSNTNALQEDFKLTYVVHGFYLQKLLLEALLQGHILDIPNHDAPTGLYSIFNLPTPAGTNIT